MLKQTFLKSLFKFSTTLLIIFFKVYILIKYETEIGCQRSEALKVKFVIFREQNYSLNIVKKKKSNQ